MVPIISLVNPRSPPKNNYRERRKEEKKKANYSTSHPHAQKLQPHVGQNSIQLWYETIYNILKSTMCINIKIHSKQIWPQALPVNTGGCTKRLKENKWQQCLRVFSFQAMW